VSLKFIPPSVQCPIVGDWSGTCWDTRGAGVSRGEEWDEIYCCGVLAAYSTSMSKRPVHVRCPCLRVRWCFPSQVEREVASSCFAACQMFESSARKLSQWAFFCLRTAIRCTGFFKDDFSRGPVYFGCKRVRAIMCVVTLKPGRATHVTLLTSVALFCGRDIFFTAGWIKYVTRVNIFEFIKDGFILRI
jgi:hypothetical protein